MSSRRSSTVLPRAAFVSGGKFPQTNSAICLAILSSCRSPAAIIVFASRSGINLPSLVNSSACRCSVLLSIRRRYAGHARMSNVPGTVVTRGHLGSQGQAPAFLCRMSFCASGETNSAVFPVAGFPRSEFSRKASTVSPRDAFAVAGKLSQMISVIFLAMMSCGRSAAAMIVSASPFDITPERLANSSAWLFTFPSIHTRYVRNLRGVESILMAR